MPAVTPRAVFSDASAYVASALGGGATTVGLAEFVRTRTDMPDADGTSLGRLDRAEAKEMFSGPEAPSTILPLATAFLAIGTLYTKGRLMLPERGGAVPAAVAGWATKAGTEIKPGEGFLNKMIYTYSGGAIFGSFGARDLVFGEDRFQTRHVPVDGNGAVVQDVDGARHVESPVSIGAES